MRCIKMNNDELYHYGILGMKWGVHRARKKEALNARRNAYDKAEKELTKSMSSIEKNYKRGQLMSKKDTNRESEAERKYVSALDKADKEYKRAKKDRSNDAKIADRLYSMNSKDANKQIASMTTGQAIARSMLKGSYGSLKYEQAKARGVSTGQAYAETLLKSHINFFLGGIPGTLEYLDNRRARK